MLIDIHAHLGRILREYKTLTAEDMISYMDGLGIDKSVILPLSATPEGLISFYTNEQVLDACGRHPDRLIPFCKLDPRQMDNSPDTDFSWLLDEYKELGCRGVGELTANLYIDDPRCRNLFKYCGRAGMPVLFHLASQIGGTYGLVDDIYLPRLDKVAGEFADTVFIGHAMAFWAEISGNVEESQRMGYPKGPVGKPGRLAELLRKHGNLYGDLSAGSGYNAITRDPEFGFRFLEEFQDKLLFGTDICHHHQNPPIAGYFAELKKSGRISKTAFEKITHLNAERLLG